MICNNEDIEKRLERLERIALYIGEVIILNFSYIIEAKEYGAFTEDIMNLRKDVLRTK